MHGVGAGNGRRSSNQEIDDLFTKAAQPVDLPALPLVDRSQLDVARPEVGGVFQAPYFYYRLDILWRKQ